jgi:hypothetical protein
MSTSKQPSRRARRPSAPPDEAQRTAVQRTAGKIADDLRARLGLRARGDVRKLRPNEVEVMVKHWRDIDQMIARRIRALLRRGARAQ